MLVYFVRFDVPVAAARAACRTTAGCITRRCCGRPRVASSVCLWNSVPWRVALAATERHPLCSTCTALSIEANGVSRGR
jgi:hypothetical protein